MMIQTQNIHSLTDFQRNTSGHIKRLQASGMPEVLTVKGRAELVVQSAESYQALLSKLELYESATAIDRGIKDMEAGRTTTLAEFDQRMRSRQAKPRMKK